MLEQMVALNALDRCDRCMAQALDCCAAQCFISSEMK